MRTPDRLSPDDTTSRRLAALALVLLAALCALATPRGTQAAPGESSALARQQGVRDSPGYFPPADPESASLRIGRRTNAPRVSMPLHGGARSLDALGRTICRQLHHEQRDSLFALCVNDGEFRTILWREFPQSRPATGLKWEDGWSMLAARLSGGCNGAVRDYGGHAWQFVRFEKPDSVGVYRNFRLLSGLRMIVRGDEGRTEEWRWVRAVVERKGVYKIYSLND